MIIYEFIAKYYKTSVSIWVICSKSHVIYTKSQYFQKCKELDLLPLKTRLDFFAILLFHKIINNAVPIKLPNYINLGAPTILRNSHRDPLMFESSIKPRITKKPTTKLTNYNKRVMNNTNLKLKNKVVSKKTKIGRLKCKKQNKVSKSF